MSDAVLKPQLIIRQFDNLTLYADRFVEMKALKILDRKSVV